MLYNTPVQALIAITGISAGWVTLGVLSVGAVVLAHLHARVAGRAVWFPAARFLVPSASERKWPRRLREFLLLLTRCVCIYLLAMVFDRPSVTSESLPEWLAPALPEASEDASGNKPVALVVVLDVSDSMRTLEDGRTRFERAVDATRALVEQAESKGQPVAIIIAGHTARPLSPRPTDRYDELRAALGELEPTREHANLDAALASVERLTTGAGLQSVDVRVVTDGQSSAWSRVPTRLDRGHALQLVMVARDGLPLGVHPVAIASDRQRLDAGERVRFSATLRNTGRVSVTSPVRWTILQGGQVVNETQASAVVEPGSLAEVGFEAELVEPGVYAIALDVPGTERSAAHSIVVVRPDARIGILAREPEVAQVAMAAADPFGRDRAVWIDPASPEASAQIASLDLAILVGAGLVPERVTDALVSHVLASGCGLVHFVDSEGAIATGNALAERFGSLYPVELEGRYVERSAADPGYAGTVALEDPPAPLPDDALTAGWFDLQVRRHAPAIATDEESVAIALEDGSPLLVVARRTSPVVATVLTGIDSDSSDLWREPELPILIDAMLRATQASSGGSDPDIRNAVGDIGDRVRSVGLRSTGPIVGPVREPGVYVATEDGASASGEAFLAAMSVNPAEYDPATADLEQIVASRRVGATSSAVVSSDDLIERRMQQVEIWPLLLAGAVLLLVIECGLLVMGRARANAVGGTP